jgi:hypothetical protein
VGEWNAANGLPFLSAQPCNVLPPMMAALQAWLGDDTNNEEK